MNAQDVRAAELLLGRRLAGLIRDVDDFPRPGVTFKDITPLLADQRAFTELVGVLAAMSERCGATKVVGLEARGFILAAPAAVQAGIGFVPIRKAAKLPGATLGRDYELEYGSERIEVHSDAFEPGDRVVVIDDVLATGGTAEASVHLIREAGAEVAGVSVLLELSFLAGRDRLKRLLGGAPLEAVITV
ncbi:adenine phosphoribosyltransferase [Streptomyces sp. NPDC059224]|uniref:adenine phosphoribosyltransferase n=1 Tax=Streptomyces sp. NPDC059224 TaxID=3346775 RepID=UPI0036BBA11F